MLCKRSFNSTLPPIYSFLEEIKKWPASYRATVELLVKAGRARWKIENEGFNTLKDQGYHLEHNIGHGK